MFSETASFRMTSQQLELVNRPLDAKLFLEGPAGAGKTTAAVEWLLRLMAEGIPGSSILLMIPQHTLAEPYNRALIRPGVLAGGQVTVLTIGGLARRMLELFWPVAAMAAGFSRPDAEPIFLTLETAQYYMAHLVRPLLEEGIFESVSMDRNRLYSQILDNLNKAAIVGFSHTEIGERLKEAWVGEPGQIHVYDDVQMCANLFRRYCLEHNLLDFSLQMEIFRSILWLNPLCRSYLATNYRHLIFDNLEEDTPLAHDILREWLPEFDSALLVQDWHGGFRRFLGADPQSALTLRDMCTEQVLFEEGLVMSAPVQELVAGLGAVIKFPTERYGPDDQMPRSEENQPSASKTSRPLGKAIREALVFEQHHYYPQMLDWVGDQITALIVSQGIPPSEIVVLAPFLSDALRFSLINRLQAREIPVRSYRPSRALREEPAAGCLLTLACLAYPEWRLAPAKSDVAYALMQAISGLDLVRAQLLTEIVYRVRDRAPALSSFDQINSDIQARITYRLGERFEILRGWLMARQAVPQRTTPDEFDYFLSRMFGEVLSQPGFGFHSDYIAGEVTANLIESIQKFRWAAGGALAEEGIPLGLEYLHMVQEGVIAAQYIRSWQTQPDEAVLIAPAFTFLMSNRPVRVQFWLDAGSRGWAERLNQPLTHPYVLSRGWSRGRLWTDYDEVATGQELLYNLALGLLHRCRERLYLGLSELGEQGYETRGPLLQALQRVLLSVDR
jgi:hypothetical protein